MTTQHEDDSRRGGLRGAVDELFGRGERTDDRVEGRDEHLRDERSGMTRFAMTPSATTPSATTPSATTPSATTSGRHRSR